MAGFLPSEPTEGERLVQAVRDGAQMAREACFQQQTEAVREALFLAGRGALMDAVAEHHLRLQLRSEMRFKRIAREEAAREAERERRGGR